MSTRIGRKYLHQNVKFDCTNYLDLSGNLVDRNWDESTFTHSDKEILKSYRPSKNGCFEFIISTVDINDAKIFAEYVNKKERFLFLISLSDVKYFSKFCDDYIKYFDRKVAIVPCDVLDLIIHKVPIYRQDVFIDEKLKVFDPFQYLKKSMPPLSINSLILTNQTRYAQRFYEKLACYISGQFWKCLIKLRSSAEFQYFYTKDEYLFTNNKDKLKKLYYTQLSDLDLWKGNVKKLNKEYLDRFGFNTDALNNNFTNLFTINIDCVGDKKLFLFNYRSRSTHLNPLVQNISGNIKRYVFPMNYWFTSPNILKDIWYSKDRSTSRNLDFEDWKKKINVVNREYESSILSKESLYGLFYIRGHNKESIGLKFKNGNYKIYMYRQYVEDGVVICHTNYGAPREINGSDVVNNYWYTSKDMLDDIWKASLIEKAIQQINGKQNNYDNVKNVNQNKDLEIWKKKMVKVNNEYKDPCNVIDVMCPDPYPYIVYEEYKEKQKEKKETLISKINF
tara:strand:- start:4713 stop:6230 length:1518 start_codon:yes stop_codon:yes gene_type:complete